MAVGLYSGVSGLALGTGLYKDVSGLWGGASGLINGFAGTSPSLYLNFLAGAPLDPRVTFSRGTTATFVGSNGFIQTAAINEPRFDYDPVTLAPKGLLIEEARTNLLTYSQEFDNAAWVQNAATVTANTIVAPDGTTTADTVTESVTTDVHIVYKFITLSSATTNTMSVYLKAGTRSFAMLRVGGGAYPTAPAIKVGLTGVGTVATIEGPVTSSSVTLAGNGWYRATMTFVAPGLNTYAPQFGPHDNGSTITYTGNGTGSVYAWGAQLEAGAFATSYIPTVASQVTRNADIATMTGTNFSSWYNQSEGTIVASVDTVAPTGSTILSFQDGAGASTNRQQMNVYTTCTATVVGGVTQSNIGVNTSAAVNLAYAYKANDFAVSANGGAVAVDNSGTVPTTLAYATLGKWDYGTAASLNGHIRQIAYYNTRLPNATLQSLTA